MERVVLRLMCDERGEISFLFGSWGAVNRDQAIDLIESGERFFTLQRPDGSRAPISIVGAGPEKRLRAFTRGAEVLNPAAAMQIRA
jgi:hypothetical protein